MGSADDSLQHGRKVLVGCGQAWLQCLLDGQVMVEMPLLLHFFARLASSA